MLKRFIVIFILLYGTLFCSEVISGDGSPVDYSKIGLSARYWGMGKVGTAFSDDSGGILINPAGLGRMKSLEISSMQTSVLGEFNYSLLNVVYPLGDETFGMSVLYEDAGTIYGSTSLDTYGHPEKGDTIENYNRLYTFAYGRKLLLDNLYLGGSVRFLQKKLGITEANSTAVDLGAIYKWDKEISFGLVVKNAMQNGITYSNGAVGLEPYETVAIAGVAWSLFEKEATLAIDYHMGRLPKLYIGGEYWWERIFAIRAGMAENDMTLGLGIRLSDWQFDYGVRYQTAPLDNQAYISITYGDARRSELRRPVIYLLEEEETSLYE